MFGVLVSVCIAIGIMFIVCEIGNSTVKRYTRIILPYLAERMGGTLLMGFFPGFVMFFPNLLMN